MKNYVFSCILTAIVLSLVSCSGIATPDVDYFAGGNAETRYYDFGKQYKSLLVIEAKDCDGTSINSEMLKKAYPEKDFGLVEAIVIEKGITKIEDRTFADDFSSLKIVLFLSEVLVEIGADAFKNATALKNVKIPESVKIIRQGAFVGCKALTDIYFEGTGGWYYIDGNNQQEVVFADTSENTEEAERKKSKNAAKVLTEGDGSKYDLFRAA